MYLSFRLQGFDGLMFLVPSIHRLRPFPSIADLRVSVFFGEDGNQAYPVGGTGADGARQYTRKYPKQVRLNLLPRTYFLRLLRAFQHLSFRAVLS